MKNTIANKYKELAAKKDLNKITVKTLSEECGISRQTFYYYFEDVTEVLRYVIIEFCSTLSNECMKEPDLNQSLQIFFLRIKEQFPFIRNVVDSPFRRLSEQITLKAVQEMLMHLSKGWENTTFSSHTEVDFQFHVISCGIVGYMEEQAFHCTIDEKDWAKYVTNLMNSRRVIRNTQ